jgi:predicted alpha/beta superfamily hydrolase
MAALKHELFPREMIVYLPPQYEAGGERRFPVLYMHDGQNLFDPETSFIPGTYWRMGETADELIEAGAIEPLIIVGIYNAGAKRNEEYTPPGADAYGRLLVEELKPFIDAHYRTAPEHCGMGGSSLGGWVTLYLGLRYPTVFSQLAVMSPSIWWGKGIILRIVTALQTKPGSRIWLDIGTKESTRSVPDARALRDGLIRKGWVLGEDLAYFEADGAAHSESAWAERVAPMLRFLYPALSHSGTAQVVEDGHRG